VCHVDKKSLIDLGILANGAGEWPLRSLLDHTHSKAAHHALETLLANPLDNIDEIAGRQQLLRALPKIIEHLNWSVLGEQLHQLESYLDSNYVVFPASTFDATMFVLRYADIAKSVEEHVLAAEVFLDTCAQIREGLGHLKGDARFREILDVFDAVFATSLRTELRVARDATSQRKLAICRLDGRFRIDLRALLLKLVASFHRFDAFCSLARTSQGLGLVVPRMMKRTDGPLVVYGLHHPLVKKARSNEISPTAHERVMFLTGPNMAGKSTLLRALGMVVVFAHLGLPVPATHARIPLTDRVIASLGNEDNILRAESLYLAEVRRVKSVVVAVAEGELVVALLDEAFRGTNVKDAGDATTLLVTGLSHAPFGLFAISSHLIEVADNIGAHPGIGFWHLEVESRGENYAFTYQLARGVSHVRLGMALLKSEGVVDLLASLSAPRAAVTPAPSGEVSE